LANHKSAEKRARQATKREDRNNKVKSSVKTFEKALVKAIEAKSKDVAELLKSYVSKIDKAAQKGVFARSTASRKIGRLSARAQAFLK
jgi:small subunit ribosomal protein S20